MYLSVTLNFLLCTCSTTVCMQQESVLSLLLLMLGKQGKAHGRELVLVLNSVFHMIIRSESRYNSL